MPMDPEILCRLHLKAVVPRIADLCRAKASATDGAKPFTLRLSVLGGPSQGLFLDAGESRPASEDEPSDVLLAFLSPSQLNSLFTNQGLAVPLPLKGFWRVSALRQFAAWAKELEKTLKPQPAALERQDDLELYVRLSLYIALAATAELAGHEPYSASKAGKLPDGLVEFSVAGTDIAAWILKKGGSFTSGTGKAPQTPDATLVLDSLETARKLVEDRLDTLAAVGLGEVRISGLIPLIDGLGLVMERVALYLQPKN